MKPEINKWYYIEYGVKNPKTKRSRAFYGPALCVKKAREGSYGKKDHWLFRTVNMPNKLPDISLMAFCTEDIKEECTEMPSYWDLLEIVESINNDKCNLIKEKCQLLNWLRKQEKKWIRN